MIFLICLSEVCNIAKMVYVAFAKKLLQQGRVLVTVVNLCAFVDVEPLFGQKNSPSLDCFLF